MTETHGTGRNSESDGKELQLTGPAKIVIEFLERLLASDGIKQHQVIKVCIYRHTYHYEIETTLREGVE